VGSFLRAGRGLVPVAVVVGLITWGSLSTPWDEFPRGGFGDLDISPTSAAQLDPVYARTVGDIDADLSGLDLTSGSGVVRTEILLGAGSVQLTVPDDADLTLFASTGAGSITYGDEVRDGVDQRLALVEDLGDDGVASGRPLEITVRADTGDVEVLRG